MSVVMITKWKRRDGDSSVWWPTIEEILEKNNLIADNVFLKFVVAGVVLREYLSNVAEFYYREQYPDGTVFTAIFFKSQEDLQTYTNFQTSQEYQEYEIAKNNLLNFLNIEMSVVPPFDIDITAFDFSEGQQHLMQLFDDHNVGN